MRRVLLSAALIGLIALSAPSQEARAEPIRAAVATVGLKADGPSAETLRARVRAALVGHPELTLIDEGVERQLFATVEPERSASDLKNAQRALAKAQKALRNFELDQAQAGYAKATEILSPRLGLAEAVEIDKERLALGAALAHALRNDEQISERILEYAIRYGAEGPPAWPPELSDRLKSTTPASDAQLSVKSDPPGAEVFVDGAAAGATPAQIAVRPGSHRVEVRKQNFFPADVWVTASAVGPQEAVLTLTSDLSEVLRQQSAAEPLGVELSQRVFALASANGATLILIAGLDQERIILRTITATGESDQRYDADDTDEGVRLAIAQMFQAPEPTPSEGTPVWAWLGVGAGGAAIAGGVALRMMAVDAQTDLISRRGALTQREAFDRDSDINLRATSGAVLLGVGTAAITGMAVWIVYDLIASDPP